MNKEARITKIAQIISRDKENPYATVEILWRNDKLERMPVYQIPLECLIYNKYNGRILSRTKSLESQGREINAESDEGRATIEKLLLDSNRGRNKQTLESIKKIGQEKVGIITKDGIIIDGNRRAMLLKEAGKDHFKTVVLDVTLDDDPLEIERLETIYQMGEDEKLGYNPIEKYLKAKGLRQRDVDIEKIASWMGESTDTVEEYLAVMATMDDYLQFYGYERIYTQLDGREDPFINLTKWLQNFYGEKSAKAFDGYRDSDVDDLKSVSFDYIRAKYEGKEFRILGAGLKENHFFGNKEIWKSFAKFHFEHVDPIKNNEDKIDENSENLKAHLDGRDDKFRKATNEFLGENIETHEQQLKNKQAAATPLKLVNYADSALGEINYAHKSALTPQVMDRVRAINKKTYEILGEKSPSLLLAEILDLLKSIKVDENAASREALLPLVKEIEKTAYALEKSLKSG